MRSNVRLTLFKRRPLTAIVGLLRRTRGVTSTTLQHLPMSKSREAGFSSILIILMTAVVLIGVLTTTITITLGQRKNSSNELAAYTAVLASESGQETFKARAASKPFAAAPTTCMGKTTQECKLIYTNLLTPYLASLGTVTTPNGQTTLSVASVNVAGDGSLTGVDVLSTSQSGNDAARIIRSYSSARLNVAFPRVPGALTSYPGVNISGNATVDGRTVTDPANTGLISDFMTVQNTSAAVLLPGTPVSVTVNPQDTSRLSQLKIGQYVRLPTLLNGLPGANATFKVGGMTGNQLNLLPVQVPSPQSTLASGSLALTNVLNGVASSLGTQLTVSAVETFAPGDQVSVTVAGIQYTTTVTAVNGNAITTQAWPAGTPTVLPEGTALVKSTNAVVTAGTYSGSAKQATAPGNIVSGVTGGQLITSPVNDALFQQLLGMTPTALRRDSSIFTSANFPGAVSGLTWLDTGSTQSINLNGQPKLTGKGLLVVDGDLLLNQNGSSTGSCDFSGVLVVRGNLRLQGNIQICGAVIVEGAVLTLDGLNATGIDSTITDVLGTGQKVTYDPAAIMDALNGAGPYAFTGTGNWRQQ